MRSRIDFETSHVRSWNQASESTQLVRQGCFFFHYSFANYNDHLSSNYHRFVIWCMLRRLVFDNYQRCPVPLSNWHSRFNGLDIMWSFLRNTLFSLLMHAPHDSLDNYWSDFAVNKTSNSLSYSPYELAYHENYYMCWSLVNEGLVNVRYMSLRFWLVRAGLLAIIGV